MSTRPDPEVPGAAASTEAVLDDLCDAAPVLVAPGRTVLGEVTAVEHPTRRGCVRVAFELASGAREERWLPALRGLSVRRGDRVMVVQPDNHVEPVVTGVLDGFARRPEPERITRAALALLPDERLQVTAADGAPLVEVIAGEAGPVVRLLHADAEIELPGALRLRASSIELQATRGGVSIRAEDDVVVQGEMVKLN